MTDYDQIARRIVLDNAGSCKTAAEAIATALRAAHEAGVAAERERCAGIIRRGVKLTPAPKNQSVRNYITETCWMLEKAIRKGE